MIRMQRPSVTGIAAECRVVLHMRNRTRAFINVVPSIVLSAFMLSGCAATFLVSKDCYSAFLDGDDAELTRMLCDTNDFRDILDTSILSKEHKKGLYEALCVKRSGREVRRIYGSLDAHEKEYLKLSFEKHGYDINYKPVEASGIARIGGLRENLQCPAEGPGY
jgi:hypothetical protein